MSIREAENRFTPEVLRKLLPAERADQFFEALLGDPTEGAYDLGLAFKGCRPEENRLEFEIQLRERPGKCLSCSLTYGLPQVFNRHPVINIKGLVKDIERTLGNGAKCTDWSLHPTRQVSKQLYVIPLAISLEG